MSCEHECNRDDNQNQTNVLYIVALVTEAQAVKAQTFSERVICIKKNTWKQHIFASVVYFKLELQTHSGHTWNLHLENRAL